MNDSDKCEYCEETEDLRTYNEWWTAWGRIVGDLNWQRETGRMLLCEQCRDEIWNSCAKCGELIQIEYAGFGYEWPGGEFDEVYCMPCAKKLGYTVTARVSKPV